MHCGGENAAPKFLGNREVTSKSIDERAVDRKPDQNWGVRTGLPGEAGAGPTPGRGQPARGGEVGLEGDTVAL